MPGLARSYKQAREDPEQRPALLAWHEALHLASWHAHKALLIADLLQRHRGERILVFTPDRASAYELARSHLIAPITAELPRTERQSTVDQFLDGTLRVLAGPRLLDLGVPNNSPTSGSSLSAAATGAINGPLAAVAWPRKASFTNSSPTTPWRLDVPIAGVAALPTALLCFSQTEGELVPAWLSDRDRPWLRDLLDESAAPPLVDRGPNSRDNGGAVIPIRAQAVAPP